MDRRGLGRPSLIDLPGNGTARHATVPVDVRGIMDAVRATARAGGVTAAACRILAMSLGAMVATEWAQALPRGSGRTGADQHQRAPLPSTLPQRLRPQNWAALIGMAATIGRTRARCERTVHRLTCERMDTRDADLAEWVTIGQTGPGHPRGGPPPTAGRRPLPGNPLRPRPAPR